MASDQTSERWTIRAHSYLSVVGPEIPRGTEIEVMRASEYDSEMEEASLAEADLMCVFDALGLEAGGDPPRNLHGAEEAVADMASDTLRALEELRRLTGVDEWSEGDWRALAYAEAEERVGEDRYAEVMGEVGDIEPWLHPEDHKPAIAAARRVVEEWHMPHPGRAERDDAVEPLIYELAKALRDAR